MLCNTSIVDETTFLIPPQLELSEAQIKVAKIVKQQWITEIEDRYPDFDAYLLEFTVLSDPDTKSQCYFVYWVTNSGAHRILQIESPISVSKLTEEAYTTRAREILSNINTNYDRQFTVDTVSEPKVAEHQHIYLLEVQESPFKQNPKYADLTKALSPDTQDAVVKNAVIRKMRHKHKGQRVELSDFFVLHAIQSTQPSSKNWLFKFFMPKGKVLLLETQLSKDQFQDFGLSKALAGIESLYDFVIIVGDSVVENRHDSQTYVVSQLASAQHADEHDEL